MQRREFIKTVALGTGAMLLNGYGPEKALAAARQLPGISKITEPVAIAMWDFTWMYRHYPGGEFENWDQVLDGLVLRGYNAIRIDVFPHLVSADSKGKIKHEYYFPRNSWAPVLWGNSYSMHANPRKALLEFLPKCRQRNIRVGLATWFFGPQQDMPQEGTQKEKCQGLDEFVREWDETLAFLNQHKLLDNVLYVDVLNEYPLYHGFSWLTDKIKSLKNAKLTDVLPDGKQAPASHIWKRTPGGYTEAQRAFYTNFMTVALKKLTGKWPNLDFFTSQSAGGVPWQDMNYSQFAAMDIHYWFVFNNKLSGNTGYWKHIHGIENTPNDHGLAQTQAKLHRKWHAHKAELIKWMEGNIQSVADIGKQCKIPYGNTEGWGPINWMDHPSLNWDLVKQSGEICARLGAKYGYTFNCSSNFTHPQFTRLWRDIKWHQKVTSIIRNG